MSYGKVKETFWTDKKVQAMSDDAKMLALYLLTGPHRNMLGCMRVPNGYITEDLKWSSERLGHAIDMLCGCRFIVRDDDGWTLITNQLKHDPLSKTPNHVKSAVAIANAVPPEVSFYQEFATRFTAALVDIGEASSWHPQGIAIPLPSPLPEPLPEPEPPAAQKPEDGFDVFWEVYPLKKDRGHALKAFIATRKRGVPLETLISAAKAYRDDPGRDPKFTKYAQGWLTGECWNDQAAQPPPATKTMTPEEREIRQLKDYAEIIVKQKRAPSVNFSNTHRDRLLQLGMVTSQNLAEAGI